MSMSPNEMIAVIEAKRDGKEVEQRYNGGAWESFLDGFAFAFLDSYEYRIKPEPRTIWVNEYNHELMSGHLTKENAEKVASNDAIRVAVKYQEVVK